MRTFPLAIKNQTLILGIARDITERKRAEGKIREQAALLDRAQDAILVTDLNDAIVYLEQERGTALRGGRWARRFAGKPRN